MSAQGPLGSADYVRPKRGDRYVSSLDSRPASRVFIEVTRRSRDGHFPPWVDIRCYTWAVMWAKRMHIWPIDGVVLQHWDQRDLNEQMADWEAKQAEAQSDGRDDGS